MACGCNRGGKNSKYIYTDPKGASTEYRTEIEAKAAKIRNGGGSISAVSR